MTRVISVIVLLFVICAYADVFTFNSTYEADCAFGCDFNNATLWNGGVAPGTNASISIIFQTWNSAYYVLYNQTGELQNLEIQNVNLQIGSGADLELATLDVKNGGVLTVTGKCTVDLMVTIEGTLALHGNAKFYATENFDGNFTVTGALIVNDNSLFIWMYGDCNFFGVVNATSETTIACNDAFFGPPAQINIYSVFSCGIAKILTDGEISFYGGLAVDYVSVSANSSLDVDSYFSGQAYVGDRSWITVNNMNQTVFKNQMYSDSPPIGGTGRVMIYNSIVNITSSGDQVLTFDGTIYIGSLSNLYLTNFGLEEIDVIISDSDAGTIVGDNFAYYGSSGFYQMHLISVGRGIAFYGNTSIIDGSLTAVGTPLNVYGALEIRVATDVSLGGNYNFSLMTIDDTSTLSILSGTVIQGELVNNGRLSASPSNSLFVSGYIQGPSATLAVVLVADQGPSLTVQSSAEFHGSLEYTLNTQPLKGTSSFLAVVAPGYTGGFGPKAVPNSKSVISRQLSLAYQSTEILVNYDFNVSDLPKWVWGVGSVGVLVVIAIIAAVIIRCRRRKRYQPLT